MLLYVNETAGQTVGKSMTFNVPSPAMPEKSYVQDVDVTFNYTQAKKKTLRLLLVSKAPPTGGVLIAGPVIPTIFSHHTKEGAGRCPSIPRIGTGDIYQGIHARIHGEADLQMQR